MNFIPESILITCIKILITLLIALVANAVLRSLITVPPRLDTRRGRTYVMIVRNAISIGIFTIALQFIFVFLNINHAPLFASAGIVGIAIGIGSRSLFEDLIAGVFLISQSKIAVGDYLVLGSGVEGTVESIGFKNLTLVSGNGALTLVPNGQIKTVTNNSFGNAIMVVDIPVKTGQPIDTITNVFQQVLDSLEKDPKYTLLPSSKVIGIKSVDVHGAFIMSVLLVSHSNLRYVIDQEYRYRLVKAFEKKKLKLV